MTLARGEREWALLVSEYNICKKKLESKRQALKILMGDLESCQRERDIYKNKIKQMQQDLDNFKRKEREQESKEIRGVKSPTGLPSRSPEHAKFKRERKLSGHSIWEQELQSVRDRKNKTLSQLLCEAREENKALKNDFMDLRVLYREAQEDIILLRENVARQKANDKDTGKMEDLEARQDLIQCLEKNQEKMEELDREVKAITDEKNEIAIEREHYREKVERLNTQLNFILGADDRRLVDIDAILMENRYQKEQIKQLREELRIANASQARQKAAMEKKKARLIKAGYNHHPSAFMGTGVKQALPSLISEISSSFGGGMSSSTANDLQSLANSLSESLSEKDIALLHQKNTNRILGHRVTELENKLKTLEVSGLWSLEGHRGYGSEEMSKLHLEKLKRSPHSSMAEAGNTPATGLNGEAESTSAESSPDLENMDSVFFAGSEHFDGDQDQLVDVSSPASASEEDEELEHLGRRESLDDEAFSCVKSKEDQGSSDGDYQTMGDSLLMKNSHANEDSLTNGDSHETDDSKIEDSFCAEYQTKGDSHITEDCLTKGDSHITEDCLTKEDSHITEDCLTKGDSHITEDCLTKGDSHITEDCLTKGDSHENEDFPLKGDSHENEDFPIKGDSYDVDKISQKEDSSVTEDSQLEEKISVDEDAKGDSLSKGDSHAEGESSSKEESLSVSDTCSLDNSEKSSFSLERNFLNNNLELMEYDSSDIKDSTELKDKSTNHDECEPQDNEVPLDVKNKEGENDHPYSSDEIEKNLSNSHLVESADIHVK